MTIADGRSAAASRDSGIRQPAAIPSSAITLPGRSRAPGGDATREPADAGSQRGQPAGEVERRSRSSPVRRRAPPAGAGPRRGPRSRPGASCEQRRLDQHRSRRPARRGAAAGRARSRRPCLRRRATAGPAAERLDQGGGVLALLLDRGPPVLIGGARGAPAAPVIGDRPGPLGHRPATGSQTAPRGRGLMDQQDRSTIASLAPARARRREPRGSASVLRRCARSG